MPPLIFPKHSAILRHHRNTSDTKTVLNKKQHYAAFNANLFRPDSEAASPVSFKEKAIPENIFTIQF